ncbi:MAG TPA: endonuclease/exonuclease/phosphatase family protein [Puia sp.]|nr:endonuclease/exonuclease/phosphatase family protein [Puia sp.]
MELTLVTINTWKCDGDYYNRRAVLKQQLMEMDAQVILCQECFRSADGRVDTLEWLSQALGMTAWFVPCRQKLRRLEDRWVDSFSGLGILTSLPVVDQMVIDLPSDLADGGRKAQLLTIELHTGAHLLIANIHLTHLPDEELRRRQLEAILASVESPDAAFRVIGGDWNAETHSLVLAESMGSVYAADCYVLGQGGEPRCSLLACHRKGLSICVDHFYTLPARAAGGGSSEPSGYPCCVRAGVVLDQPDANSGLYPSDHFGIRITLIY